MSLGEPVYILCCDNCRGSGHQSGTPPKYKDAGKCQFCGGTGYPRGYTPPSREEILAYSFPKDDTENF